MIVVEFCEARPSMHCWNVTRSNSNDRGCCSDSTARSSGKFQMLAWHPRSAGCSKEHVPPVLVTHSSANNAQRKYQLPHSSRIRCFSAPGSCMRSGLPQGSSRVLKYGGPLGACRTLDQVAQGGPACTPAKAPDSSMSAKRRTLAGSRRSYSDPKATSQLITTIRMPFVSP